MNYYDAFKKLLEGREIHRPSLSNKKLLLSKGNYLLCREYINEPHTRGTRVTDYTPTQEDIDAEDWIVDTMNLN